jgi:hypothetical protein
VIPNAPRQRISILRGSENATPHSWSEVDEDHFFGSLTPRPIP